MVWPSLLFHSMYLKNKSRTSGKWTCAYHSLLLGRRLSAQASVLYNAMNEMEYFTVHFDQES